MKYFDTHAHLNSKYFNEDSNKAVEEALANGVDKIVLPGTTAEDSLTNIEFAKEHKGVFAMAGIHPSDSTEYNPKYLMSIDPEKIVGIGEVGFDFYHEENPTYEIQKKCFVDHIEFAIKHNKPLVIHMRNAEKETYEILSKYENIKFMLHCYTGGVDWIKKFIDLGAYVSMSGVVTFKNAGELKEVAKIVPDDKLVIETDSPFLAPVPKRGKPNQPAYVKHVGDYLVELREDKDLLEKLYKNSLEFFGL